MELNESFLVSPLWPKTPPLILANSPICYYHPLPSLPSTTFPLKYPSST
jgi:hypothetical protein